MARSRRLLQPVPQRRGIHRQPRVLPGTRPGGALGRAVRVPAQRPRGCGDPEGDGLLRRLPGRAIHQPRLHAGDGCAVACGADGVARVAPVREPEPVDRRDVPPPDLLGHERTRQRGVARRLAAAVREVRRRPRRAGSRPRVRARQPPRQRAEPARGRGPGEEPHRPRLSRQRRRSEDVRARPRRGEQLDRERCQPPGDGPRRAALPDGRRHRRRSHARRSAHGRRCTVRRLHDHEGCRWREARDR